MGNDSVLDSSYSLFGADPGAAFASVVSPASADSIVGPPPDGVPDHQPGQGTPLTGNLAAAPKQAVAKNLDTQQGRSAYAGVSNPPNGGFGATTSVQPAQVMRPAQTVQPAQNGLQPAVYKPGVPLAAQQASRVQAYNAGPGPAQYAASQTPASTDMANPDPTASMRPGGTSPMMPAVLPAQPGQSPIGLQPVQGPSQLDKDQNKLSMLTNTGSGVSQIKNPFLRGLARVGDVAGSILAPGVAAAIPGTTLHHQQLLGQQQAIVGNDQAQQQAAAALQDTQQQTQERAAKAQQDIANAGKSDRYDPNAVHTVNTAEGVMGFNPDTGQYDRRIGGSPDKLQEGERPLATMVPQLNKTLQDRYQVLNPGKPLPPQYQLPATATQKDYDRIDKALAGVESAQGTQTQRQQANAMRAQAQAATEAARAAGGSAALDREIARFAKPYEKANETASTQLDKIDDAANMIGGNAEAQALGIPKVLTALVGGQGTGVRITTPELQAIAHARSWAGDFEGTLNSISGKGKLSSTQQQQLKQILSDVKTRITQKRQITNDALDKINGGTTRDDVIAADREARQKLTDLESGGSKPAAKAAGGFDWGAHPKVNP